MTEQSADAIDSAEPEQSGSSVIDGAPDSHMTATDFVRRAFMRQRTGKFVEAEADFRSALAIDPEQSTALNMLGLQYFMIQRREEGIRLLTEACRVNPESADIRVNLGFCLRRSDRSEEAEAHLRQAIEINPTHRQALTSLSKLLIEKQQWAEGIEILRRAKAFFPTLTEFRLDLVRLLCTQRRFTDAAAELEELLAGHPPEISLLTNFGYCCEQSGRHLDAENAYRRAIELPTDGTQAAVNLACLLSGQKRHAEAIDLLESLLDKRKDMQGLPLRSLLAREKFRHGKPEEAAAEYERLLREDPDDETALLSLIQTLSNARKYDRANLYARRLILAHPDQPKNFPICSMLFQCTCDFELLEELGDKWALLRDAPPMSLQIGFLGLVAFAEEESDVGELMSLHRGWGRGIEQGYDARAIPLSPPGVIGSRSRERIRVGLLSSDLRSHSVGYFALPLTDHFDSDRVEIYCYSTYPHEHIDEVEAVFRENATDFQNVADLADTDLADKIRGDGVDALIELNGMTQYSRITALAQRMAPVQVEWLGYPFTIGLSNLDYFLLDRYLRPVRDDLLHERILEMPNAWICFTDVTGAPVDERPPVEKNGFVTFGTMNNMYKYTERTIDLWAAVMRETPDSMFLVVRPEARSIVFRTNLTDAFGKRGVSAERLQFANNKTDGQMHSLYYNAMDISLDTFPLTGGTTTTDALDMGVPVVTRVGEAMHMRISYAILNHIGAPELCAHSDEDFTRIAVELANDPDRIAGYRAGLRKQVRTSPLCDSKSFCKDFEATMFRAVEQARD